jgi:hypothetical protein
MSLTKARVESSLGTQLLHVRYKEATTVVGTPTTNAWTKYPIATVVTNQIEGASLASNQVTLPAGEYRAQFQSISQFTVDRLYDTTAEEILATGFQNMVQTMTKSAHAYFSLSEESVIEYQYRTTIGVAFGSASEDGSDEIICELMFWKVG